MNIKKEVHFIPRYMCVCACVRVCVCVCVPNKILGWKANNVVFNVKFHCDKLPHSVLYKKSVLSAITVEVKLLFFGDFKIYPHTHSTLRNIHWSKRYDVSPDMCTSNSINFFYEKGVSALPFQIILILHLMSSSFWAIQNWILSYWDLLYWK